MLAQARRARRQRTNLLQQGKHGDTAMSEWARWYEGKSFSTDWTTDNFKSWSATLAHLRDSAIEILEIGSWEGRSAIFFLEFFRSGRLTCVDTFRGSQEHLDGSFDLGMIEKRFDANTASYGSRLEKLKSTSVQALDRLAQDGRSFDIIYIDGSHRREDVMADSALAWKILKQDGFVMWDDYLWGADLAAADRPGPAVDAFVRLVANEIKIHQFSAQVIGQKRASADPFPAPGWVYPRTPRNLARLLRKQPLCGPKGGSGAP
jgi:predicted O-methyltransferase YrrM